MEWTIRVGKDVAEISNGDFPITPSSRKIATI